MMFVLTSFPVLQKGSNIQPSPRAGVAQVSLAFQYILVYFVKPSSG
jgi:hypothetical protein